MAIHITNLNGGDITVGAGGSAPAAELTLTGVSAPGNESPMIHMESGIWFEGTGLEAWNSETDKIEAKNDDLEEPEYSLLTS